MDRQKMQWSSEDEAILRKLRAQGKTFREISIVLGRTVSACVNRHSELTRGKITAAPEGRSRFDPWRPEEDLAVASSYLPGGPTLLEVSEKIGRTYAACKKRARELELSEPRPPKPRPGLRKCHDCGRPTPDYRCPACRKKWQIKHGVPLDNAAKNAMGDDWE